MFKAPPIVLCASTTRRQTDGTLHTDYFSFPAAHRNSGDLLMLAELIAAFVLLVEPYGLPAPEVRFVTGIDALATTICRKDYSKCIIVINACLIDRPELLEKTAKHELAHYIAGLTTHTSDHGKQWKRIGREIGASRHERTLQRC